MTYFVTSIFEIKKTQKNQFFFIPLKKKKKYLEKSSLPHMRGGVFIE